MEISPGSLSTGNTSDMVELITMSGAIVDGGDLGIDVANSGGLVIRSDTGVGSGTDETSVGEVDAQNLLLEIFVIRV